MPAPRPIQRPLAAGGFQLFSRFLSALPLAVAVAFLALAPATTAQVTRERDLKAVLLLNLLRFVDWPSNAFNHADTPIVIGILGEDPFSRVLDNVVRSETVQDRRIVVERYATLASLRQCHLLYIADSEARDLQRILERLQSKPVLTVAEFETFAGQGGMVRLYRGEQDKLRLLINISNVRATGLNISAKLLRVAEVVKSESEQP